MISKPAVEGESSRVTSSGVIADGPVEVSAITINGGSDAATVQLKNAESDTGSILWEMKAPAGESRSVSFPKPIPFDVGVYAKVTGTSPSVLVAHTKT